jgi:hypothetical protein
MSWIIELPPCRRDSTCTMNVYAPHRCTMNPTIGIAGVISPAPCGEPFVNGFTVQNRPGLTVKKIGILSMTDDVSMSISAIPNSLSYRGTIAIGASLGRPRRPQSGGRSGEITRHTHDTRHGISARLPRHSPRLPRHITWGTVRVLQLDTGQIDRKIPYARLAETRTTTSRAAAGRQAGHRIYNV